MTTTDLTYAISVLNHERRSESYHLASLGDDLDLEGAERVLLHDEAGANLDSLEDAIEVLKGRPQDLVREFHIAFDQPVFEEPTVSTSDRRRLRYDMLLEEFDELWEALGEPGTAGWIGGYVPQAPDVVEIADALADIVYLAYGAAHEFGIDLDAVLREVHRSNMAKRVNGRVLRREDGKVQKPEGWTPPDIAGVLGLVA